MGYREKHSVETHNNHAKPIKSAVDKFALLPEFLKVRGLVKQHIDSFNYFINNDIKKIMKANDRIVCPQYPSLNLRYTKISIGKPVEYVEHTTEELTPNLCRLSDRTYELTRSDLKSELNLYRLATLPERFYGCKCKITLETKVVDFHPDNEFYSSLPATSQELQSMNVVPRLKLTEY